MREFKIDGTNRVRNFEEKTRIEKFFIEWRMTDELTGTRRSKIDTGRDLNRSLRSFQNTSPSGTRLHVLFTINLAPTHG